MRITAEPRSDQINADDLVAGPQTFTIAGVGPGKATQKYDIELVETPGRCWRPPLTMLRLLLKAWGEESSEWVGRRVTLFTDPNVTFGKDKVGGIRVSHLSHITGTVSVSSQVTRGRRRPVTAEPLIEQAPVVQPSGVPEDIVQAAAKAKADGQLEAYKNWLVEKNAPAYIMQYINEMEAK